MDIKNVKPFSKIWFDCNGNMYLSVLQSIDEKYQYIACNNEYHYVNKPASTDLCNFTMLEMYTTWSIVGDMIKDAQNVDYENDEQFFDVVIDTLNQGRNFFAGVDLFYWIKENFCFGKDHWLHSGLIQKYDEEKELFYVLDVGNDKNYGIFTIGKQELLTAVREGHARNEISFSCDLDVSAGVKNITIGSLKDNAQKLIKNLSDVVKSEYFWMDSRDYAEGYYADINYVFLGRIVQRQNANAMLIEELYRRGFINKEIMNELHDIAEELSQGWLLVQCKESMLFSQKDLRRKIENVNIKMKKLFDREKEMWTLFCKAIEEQNENDIVFKFD